MPALRETIRDAVVTQLKTISAVAQNVYDVAQRPQILPAPALIIVDRGDEIRRHIRLAWECRMNLQILCYDREGSRPQRTEDITDLAVSVIKAVSGTETWSGNAVTTYATSWVPQYSEALEPGVTATVDLMILYRVQFADPATKRSI